MGDSPVLIDCSNAAADTESNGCDRDLTNPIDEVGEFRQIGDGIPRHRGQRSKTRYDNASFKNGIESAIEVSPTENAGRTRLTTDDLGGKHGPLCSQKFESAGTRIRRKE